MVYVFLRNKYLQIKVGYTLFWKKKSTNKSRVYVFLEKKIAILNIYNFTISRILIFHTYNICIFHTYTFNTILTSFWDFFLKSLQKCPKTATKIWYFSNFLEMEDIFLMGKSKNWKSSSMRDLEFLKVRRMFENA